MSGDVEWERRLRRLRLERRELQEEVEGIAREVDAARRTLADALVEAGERGDRCLVEAGTHHLAGEVVHVGERVIGVLDTGSGRRWDVALGSVAVVAVLEPGHSARRVARGHPRTLLARARELAATGEAVEIGLATRSEPLRGRLRDVSPEVLELDRTIAARIPTAGSVRGRLIVAWSAVIWLSEVV